METQNGTDYAQNYDLIIKWLSAAFRGETLEVLGVNTGPIQDVFGFEPADISVRAGRVDVMFRAENGALYHLEAERNLRKADLYRFAAYHFLAAYQWGPNVTDIILTSGDVSVRDWAVTTESGHYSPVIIDLSTRDGLKRLEEIRGAVQEGVFENWLELVFLPLYGKETGSLRSDFAEQILRFESGLYKAGKLSAELLAAALIMSNKMVSKDRLKAIWEEINMLDILEIAKEEGLKEGKDLGMKLGMKEGKDLGMLEATREMVVNGLIEKFAMAPSHILGRVRAVQNYDALNALFRQIFRCKDIGEFEAVLNRMT